MHAFFHGWLRLHKRICTMLVLLLHQGAAALRAFSLISLQVLLFSTSILRSVNHMTTRRVGLVLWHTSRNQQATKPELQFVMHTTPSEQALKRSIAASTPLTFSSMHAAASNCGQGTATFCTRISHTTLLASFAGDPARILRLRLCNLFRVQPCIYLRLRLCTR